MKPFRPRVARSCSKTSARVASQRSEPCRLTWRQNQPAPDALSGASGNRSFAEVPPVLSLIGGTPVFFIFSLGPIRRNPSARFGGGLLTRDDSHDCSIPFPVSTRLSVSILLSI